MCTKGGFFLFFISVHDFWLEDIVDVDFVEELNETFRPNKASNSRGNSPFCEFVACQIVMRPLPMPCFFGRMVIFSKLLVGASKT
jgi:hypothetical protein